ncbi:MAG: hypothetical protein ACE5J2_05850 [Nitrososphaerales archaeon]
MKPKPCNKCGSMIIFSKNGLKPDGSIRWKPVDAETGKDHDRDVCEEMQRIGNGDTKNESKDALQTTLVDRNQNHTSLVVEAPGRWCIDIRKLNGNRMSD